MKFGVIARGNQKIYMLLTTSLPDGGWVAAESKLRNGQSVPALVLEKDRALGEYVIVLPLLHADQKVTVFVFDAEGNIVDEASKSVAHLASALKGKANTLLKVPGINEIRNFDRLSRPDCSEVRGRSISGIGFIEDKANEKRSKKDKKELVIVTVYSPCDQQELQFAPFTLSVFDRNGAEIPIENVVILGDSLEKPVQQSDYARRMIEVSFLKPRDIDWFFVQVRFENDVLPRGFVCFDDESVARMRGESEAPFKDHAAGPNYERWFYETQAASPAELEAQREVRFEIEPLYSVIVPLYKTPLVFFDEMARSVLNQTYSKLELILINASPEDETLKQHIEECALKDDRVKVIELDRNRGIALNTNEGIRAAQGDFLCFFDHDDVIELDLLFEYTKAINEYPETDLLYCDEDKLLNNQYIEAYLKPDFSWEHLRTSNYVCHLLTVRKSIVDELELSGDDVSGAQDWDMTLKVAERARNIYHVPKVLYHWRIHAGSVASGAEAKSYTHVAGEKALENHFKRMGISARIHDGGWENSHRIEYLLPEQKPLVSIIIPNKDSAGMLKNLVDSIFEKTTYDNYEIVIVENNSTEDETFEYYECLQAEDSRVRVVTYEKPFNFSAVCNLGAKEANGDYLLFLNNDMEVITPNWIELLVGPALRDEVGAVGATLLYPNDTIQHTGITICAGFPSHIYFRVPKDYVGYFGYIQLKRDVLAVTGACLLVSRKNFELVGGFDEEYVVEYNDVDLCLRLREKGKQVLMEPAVQIYHFESVSRGRASETKEGRRRHARELARFRSRWGEYMAEGDPTYGRNIADWSSTYELKWHPRL